MYGTNGKFDRIFIDGYKPIKYNFLDSSYMNLSTWVAQILHHKSIIKMILEEETKYDIVQSVSQADIFDYYYDLYKNIISIEWTDGKISPRLYGQTKPEKKKR